MLCFQMNFEYPIHSPYIEDLEMDIKMLEKRNINLKVVLIFVLTFLAYTGLLLLNQCWLYIWKYICEKELPLECIECIKMQPPNKMSLRDKNIFILSSISKYAFTNIQYRYNFAFSLYLTIMCICLTKLWEILGIWFFYFLTWLKITYLFICSLNMFTVWKRLTVLIFCLSYVTFSWKVQMS